MKFGNAWFALLLMSPVLSANSWLDLIASAPDLEENLVICGEICATDISDSGAIMALASFKRGKPPLIRYRYGGNSGPPGIGPEERQLYRAFFNFNAAFVQQVEAESQICLSAYESEGIAAFDQPACINHLSYRYLFSHNGNHDRYNPALAATDYRMMLPLSPPYLPGMAFNGMTDTAWCHSSVSLLEHWAGEILETVDWWQPHFGKENVDPWTEEELAFFDYANQMRAGFRQYCEELPGHLPGYFELYYKTRKINSTRFDSLNPVGAVPRTLKPRRLTIPTLNQGRRKVKI